MEKTGGVEREVSTEEAVLEFCLAFAETALQLENSGAGRAVESIIYLVFDNNLTQVSFVGS